MSIVLEKYRKFFARAFLPLTPRFSVLSAALLFSICPNFIARRPALWYTLTMTTIKDIVKRTGLSLGTVSKFLNGMPVRADNRAKIEAAVKELGYSYNDMGRSLKTKRSGLIGILIPSLNEAFSAEIITRAEEVLRRENYAALVSDAMFSTEIEREYLELFVRKRADGVIAVPVSHDAAAYSRLREAGIPLVFIDKDPGGADAFLLDNEPVCRDVAVRICAAGHRRIGILCGNEGLQSADERLKGFIEGLKQCGVKPDARLIKRGDYTVDGEARRMVDELLAERPDAVFASNYYFTLTLISAVNEKAVPLSSLSYVGFDNLGFTSLVRPVPYLVTQPMSEYGRLAAEKLLARIRGDCSPPAAVRLAASICAGETLLRRPV